MKHQYEIMLNSTSFLGSALLHEERGDEPLRAGAGGHDQWGDEEWFKTQNIKLLLQVEKKGVIYFDDVCKLILRKFREDDEEEFIKIMFKVSIIYQVITNQADYLSWPAWHKSEDYQTCIIMLMNFYVRITNQ